MSDHTDLVLGAMLAAPRCIDDVCDIIHGGSFTDSRDELVFDAITALHVAGHPVNTVSVGDRLEKSGDLARVGGRVRLVELAGAAVTGSAATWHAERVRDAAMLRDVHAAGVRMQALAADASADADNVLDVINAARTQLDSLVVADEVDVPAERAVYDAIASLDEPPGLPTPWPSVTETVAGWKPGGLYIVGARPATGKSIVGQAIALDAARRGKTALLFSLEMTRNDLWLRLLSAVGEVDMGRIQHRRLTKADYSKMSTAAGHLSSLPLIVDDRADMSVAQIRARVRAAKRRADVGVVVVDYLGLVRAPASAPKNDRRVQVDAISRGLKLLAKDLNVPVVALAQLNRGSEQRADKRPTMSDLRESGAIEQDADVVCLLHRDINGDDMGSTVEFIFGKNRHGPQSRMELIFRGHYSRIDEYGTHTNERSA